MKKKLLCLFLILSICIFSLTGCYDAQGIETLSYAIAIGLDKGENNVLKLSIQFATPNTIGSGSESGSSQSSTSTITSIECSSIVSGINLINSYISKQANLSHCKVIVISEELAAEGVAEYISTLVNNVQIRPTCNVIVTRCEAVNFLENAKPTFETLTARYYEAALHSGEYTAYTSDVQLNDFYSALKSTKEQPVAILAGINSEKTNISNSIYTEKFSIDSSYKADQTPIRDKATLECMGLAVFKEDKLVGELDGIEALCYSIVSNKLETCMITIPNPKDPTEPVNITLTLQRNTNNKVDLIDNSPYINVKANLEGYLTSISENSNFASDENLKLLSKEAKKYLEDQISAFLYKTSKDFRADIIGYGNYAVKNYLTWDDWVNADWLNNYQNAFFNVEVEVNLKPGELFSKV